MKITVESLIKAPIEKVWKAWNTPEDIMQWNAASDDWHTVRAEVDLRLGGTFSSRMEAKNGSLGFDLAGQYTAVIPHQLIEFIFDDKRQVSVVFSQQPEGVKLVETFDADSQYDEEFQRYGWQAILDNFTRYVEAQN